MRMPPSKAPCARYFLSTRPPTRDRRRCSPSRAIHEIARNGARKRRAPPLSSSPSMSTRNGHCLCARQPRAPVLRVGPLITRTSHERPRPKGGDGPPHPHAESQDTIAPCGVQFRHGGPAIVVTTRQRRRRCSRRQRLHHPRHRSRPRPCPIHRRSRQRDPRVRLCWTNTLPRPGEPP